MELREALGEELFSKVEAKLTEVNGADDRKDNPVRYVDLSEGSYVGREKYTRMQTESAGYKKQLEDANELIRSYNDVKDKDIEGFKQSVKDWETKYAEDTKTLQEKLAAQERAFAAERYLDGQRIKSPLSRKAILSEFLSQDMEFKDGKFIGADEYMKGVREQYPEEFHTGKREETGKKIFVRGTSGTYKPTAKSEEEDYLKKKYGNNKYSNQ